MTKYLLYLSFFARSVSGLVLVKVAASYFSVTDLVTLNNFMNLLSLIVPFSILFLQNYMLANFKHILTYNYPIKILRYFWLLLILLSAILSLCVIYVFHIYWYLVLFPALIVLFGVSALTNSYLVYRRRYRAINLYLLFGSLISALLSVLSGIAQNFNIAILAVLISNLAPLLIFALNKQTRTVILNLICIRQKSKIKYWPIRSTLITMLSMSVAPLVILIARQLLIDDLISFDLFQWEIYYRLSSFLLIFFTQPLATILAKQVGSSSFVRKYQSIIFDNFVYLVFPVIAVVAMIILKPVILTFFNLQADVINTKWQMLMVVECIRVYSWVITFIFMLRSSFSLYLTSELTISACWILVALVASDLEQLIDYYCFLNISMFVLNVFLMKRILQGEVATRS